MPKSRVITNSTVRATQKIAKSPYAGAVQLSDSCHSTVIELTGSSPSHIYPASRRIYRSYWLRVFLPLSLLLTPGAALLFSDRRRGHVPAGESIFWRRIVQSSEPIALQPNGILCSSRGRIRKKSSVSHLPVPFRALETAFSGKKSAESDIRKHTVAIRFVPDSGLKILRKRIPSSGGSGRAVENAARLNAFSGPEKMSLSADFLPETAKNRA